MGNKAIEDSRFCPCKIQR